MACSTKIYLRTQARLCRLFRTHTHRLWLLCDAAAEANPELSHSEADKEAAAVSSVCSDAFAVCLPVWWRPERKKKNTHTQARNWEESTRRLTPQGTVDTRSLPALGQNAPVHRKRGRERENTHYFLFPPHLWVCFIWKRLNLAHSESTVNTKRPLADTVSRCCSNLLSNDKYATVFTESGHPRVRGLERGGGEKKLGHN